MKCIVIGAGVAGLAAAWQVQKIPGMEVLVLEASSRAGGWVQTERKEGFLFERGARSLRPQPDTMELLGELGLTDSILWGSQAAHKRYLWHRNKLRQLPGSFLDLLSSPWIWPIVPEILRDLMGRSEAAGEGETLDAFIRRRLGPFTAEVLLDAIVRGIYAGDPRELSAEATFPSLAHCNTSLVKKALTATRISSYPASLFTLKEGLGTLPSMLAAHLNVEYSVRVNGIREEGKQVVVETEKGEKRADYVIVAAPLSFLPQEKRRSVAVVSCGYKRQVLQKEGFGYLVPRGEGEEILGVIFDSTIFPACNQQAEETRLTVMLPPRKGEEQAMALRALEKHLGITASPDVVSCSIAFQAIPQYTKEHALQIKEIEKKHPSSVYLTGASFCGVALNDGISFAKKIRTSIESQI